jgi:hypothetical protein
MTGVVLRSCVLPGLCASAVRRSVRLHVELLDPANEVACRQYRDWAGMDSAPNAQRALEIEICATILAVCAARKRSPRLHPEIRFFAFFTADQVDISDDLLVLSSADSARPVSTATSHGPLYHSYLREFDVGWSHQARSSRLSLRAVEWSPLYDGELIPARNILNLFRELHLPAAHFTDGDMDAIVERLDGHETESDDPSGGVDSA